MKQSYEHFIFGDFEHGALTEKKLAGIFEKAAVIRKILFDYPIDKIITVLDRAGRLWSDRKYPPRVNALKYMPALVGFHPVMVERAIDTLSGVLSRESIEKKITLELRSKRCLDDWTFEPSSGGFLRAKPLGTILHVSAGNVFIGGIDSLTHGLLTKNVNLLKFSGADPLFPMLFAKSLLDVDDEGIIAKSFSLLSFRAHESGIEEVLKQRCDGIVVWGGESAVLSYRKDLPVHTKLIEYGPKYSLSVITAQGLKKADIGEVCRGIAMDAAMWEQRACSSPQVVYVEGKDRASLRSFMKKLERAMKQAGADLPQGALTLDEEIEILKARELATMSMICEEGDILHSGATTDYTLIMEYSPQFKLSPLNRCLYIKPYGAWDEVTHALSSIGGYLQTVSMRGTPDELKKMTADLIALGATRITEIGHAHQGMTGAPHDGSYQLGQLVCWADIESSHLITAPDFDSVALDGVQDGTIERVNDILRYAKTHSPYYRRTIPETWRKYEDIPLLDRADIYGHTPPVGMDLLTGPLEKAFIFASGGSTGAPKFCFYYHHEFDHVGRILAEVYKEAGITLQDTVANLFMAGNLWTSFLAAHGALEKIGCVTLPIGGNADIELILKYLHLFRPTVLIGLPSVIIQIAERTAAGSMSVKKILYGGERLGEETVRFLKKVFRTEIIRSAGYASVDAGPVGFQCPSCPGTVHHLLTDYQYMEIVDPESGRRLPPGQQGEIVITNLRRKLFPVIRYRTGDSGRILKNRCVCGRESPLFELLGRCDDVIRAGTVSVHPDEIECLLDAEGVSHIFQIVAKSEGIKEHLIVTIEAQDGCGDRRLLAESIRSAVLERNVELREALQEGWLGAFSVEVVPRDSIPRVSRTGKIRKVVDLRKV